MAKKKVEKEAKAPVNKDLNRVLAELQGKFGGGSIQIGGIPAIERIPTGLWPLDVLTGGGLPRARWTQFWGPEGCGKTTLILLAAATVQKAGGKAGVIDAEHALDPAYARSLGVDTDSLLYARPDTLEQAETAMKDLAPLVDYLAMDSIVAVSGEKEIRAIEKNGMAKDSMMVIPGNLSKFFRVTTPVIGKSRAVIVLVNQTRTNAGGYVAFDDYSGGHALRHALAFCIKISQAPKEDWPKDAEDEKVILGKRYNIRVDKQKISGAPAGSTTQFTIWNKPPFVRPVRELIAGGLATGIIERAGGTFKLNGVSIVGKDAMINQIEAEQELQDALAKKLSEVQVF